MVREVDYFTGRDLELIAYQLESAIRKCGTDDALAGLREEYEHAADAVALLQDEGAR